MKIRRSSIPAHLTAFQPALKPKGLPTFRPAFKSTAGEPNPPAPEPIVSISADSIQRVWRGEDLARISPYPRGTGEKPLTFFLTPENETVFSFGGVVELARDGISMRDQTISVVTVPIEHDFIFNGEIPAHLFLEKIAQQGGLRVIARIRSAPGKDLPYLFMFTGWSDIQSIRSLNPGEQVALHTKIGNIRGQYKRMMAEIELSVYSLKQPVQNPNEKEGLVGLTLNNEDRIFSMKTKAMGQPATATPTDHSDIKIADFSKFIATQTRGMEGQDFDRFQQTRFSLGNMWFSIDALLENKYDYLGIKHLPLAWHGFKSHFGEDNAVVPGVVLLEWALQTAGLQAVKKLRAQGQVLSDNVFSSFRLLSCAEVRFSNALFPRMVAGIKIDGEKGEGFEITQRSAGVWEVLVKQVTINGFKDPDSLNKQLVNLAYEGIHWTSTGTPIVSFPGLKFLIVDPVAATA